MKKQIYTQIEKLLAYGVQKKLLPLADVDYSRNQLLDRLGLDAPMIGETLPETNEPIYDILAPILDWAADNGLLEANTVTYRDLFDTKLIDALLPRPSTVIDHFFRMCEQQGPQAATAAFYQFCKDAHYIRTDRIALNESWLAPTPYGDLEITINLSKPEKDPVAIAAAKKVAPSDYPKGLLAKENVGFAGRATHPARQNLRLIPVTLGNEQWYMQFSPYVYYEEHAIVLFEKQRPMQITADTFTRLLEFVQQYTHYFIGSNADLPIVGGSILSHDHYQGGKHTFPMAKAPLKKAFTLKGYPTIKAGIVKWPMSVIRLASADPASLQAAATAILSAWKTYSDPSLDIYANSDGTPHNTITPIARNKSGMFELDLVLRNNRTTKAHPLGLFHPHADVHAIKKENIGLIEVMGLAVLPGRLKQELAELATVLPSANAAEQIEQNEAIAKHKEWALSLKEQKPNLTTANVEALLKQEVGRLFTTVLSHAGVFKDTDSGEAGFIRFLKKSDLI
ncbi:galactose-1-phosphate uridylyltransferase [Shouchella clausii]|uniref:UDP-glucose--hexose-1-phosphate uridylyltransferase n=1 Tax=Shouchella TaxID=2893057 RepID=UPI000BA5C763|nr:UDP-glucose--hexose-1-phosphate uridylyltransferase [Shouchella clausii]PAF09575.1 UDP-glucose--hexose-1-phosphate uridylyltransferase [Shouchella clausii]GIN15138.1 galactose-1-phosphate uridylyltransferase [Shouchella clausii]